MSAGSIDRRTMTIVILPAVPYCTGMTAEQINEAHLSVARSAADKADEEISATLEFQRDEDKRDALLMRADEIESGREGDKLGWSKASRRAVARWLRKEADAWVVLA